MSLRLFPVSKENHLRMSTTLSGFSGLLHEKGNHEFSIISVLWIHSIVLPSARAVDQLCWWGGLMKCGPCLFLPESQRTLLNRETWLTGGKGGHLISSLKDLAKLPHYPRLSARCFWEREEGHCGPTEIHLLTVSSKVLVYPGLGVGVDHVASGEPLCWRWFQAFSELFPSVHSKLPRSRRPNRAKSEDHWDVARHGREAKQCFWWSLPYDLLLLIPACQWHMVYKLFLLSPQAKTTGMEPGRRWRPLQLGQWREPTESTHMDVIKNKHEGKITVMSKVVTDFLYLPGFLLLYPQQTSNCLSVFLRGPLLLPTLLHS